MDKKTQAQEVLGEVLLRMGYQAQLDFKDAEDGGLSVAMTLNGELPGAPVGRRSHVVDSLQFLINKIVNRSPENRRWISLGLGDHPTPRAPKPAKQPAPTQVQAPTVVAGESAVPTAAPSPRRVPVSAREPREPKVSLPHKTARNEPDEASLEVTPDEELAAAVRTLAETAAKRGRFMAILGMQPDNRARVLQAVQGVEGVRAKAEGEGRNRRIAFVPEKPAPMPKHALAVWEEELQEEMDAASEADD